jgi:hypothetical protein
MHQPAAHETEKLPSGSLIFHLLLDLKFFSKRKTMSWSFQKPFIIKSCSLESRDVQSYVETEEISTGAFKTLKLTFIAIQ